MSACSFTNNQGSRGAIDNRHSNLTVKGSTFTNNRATYHGGAIYNTGILKLNTVTFKNNIVNGVYNAIYNDGGSVTKTGVTITPTDGIKVGSANDPPNKNPNTPASTKKADLKITKITKKGNYRYVTIKNIGKKATAKKFYLGVYVGKKLIKKVLVKILGVGKSATIKVLIAKKYKAKLKTFKADSTNSIIESNEKNNSLKTR